jgi:hypothetical protein
MDDRNPYAPSQATLNIVEPASGDDTNTGVAVWRDGDQLIKLIGAEMPPRCVKCNAPAEAPTKSRKLYWHHPGLYLLLLANVVIYAIIAAIVRKKAFVAAGLCKEHKKRRKIALICAWTGSLGGIVVMFLGMGSSWGFWAVSVGVLLILASVIVGLIFSRIVYAKKIDKSHVRLKGCGVGFLASLPPFPG